LVAALHRLNVSTESIEVIAGTFFPLLGYLFIVGGVIFALSEYLEPFFGRVELRFSGIDIELKKELNRATARVEAEPERVKPAWDLARVKFELYIDRNLSQITYIFWLSVVVMLMGFGIILFGISRAFTPVATIDSAPTTISPAVLGTLAGIITEFIGATFLFLYRATAQQAANYMRALERINSVGMAMQILDTISGEAGDLQDRTKAELVKLFVGGQAGDISKRAEADEAARTVKATLSD
jgi:nitrate reductase gamma subunit